jgi:hypothetical protein
VSGFSPAISFDAPARERRDTTGIRERTSTLCELKMLWAATKNVNARTGITFAFALLFVAAASCPDERRVTPLLFPLSGFFAQL